MPCSTCVSWKEVTDFALPYAVRKCSSCGREVKLRNSGKGGVGLKLNTGDRVVLPSGFIQVSANPLKGNGHLTKDGIDWFAEMVFATDISARSNMENFESKLVEICDSNALFFKGAEYLQDLDLDNEAHADEVWGRISKNERTPEWWGFIAGAFASIAADAIKAGDASQAAWAATASERMRALAIFKEHFSDAVFMGQSARRLVQLLNVWEAQKHNGDEAFWQATLSDNSYVFNQLFSSPVTVMEESAYVGGMKLDRKDARFLDFLLTSGASNSAVLVEIKNPKSDLISKRKYRKNVYGPSPELVGAVVQINDYLDQLRGNVEQLMRSKDKPIEVFSPKRLIILGNAEVQLDDETKRKSFEMFRASLLGVEIITFDELFSKIEHLARLFNLIRK